jgi:hypothetical protein
MDPAHAIRHLAYEISKGKNITSSSIAIGGLFVVSGLLNKSAQNSQALVIARVLCQQNPKQSEHDYLAKADLCRSSDCFGTF